MEKTFLRADWEHLVMANYRVEPSMLEPYLPKGVELDYYNGSAYVSLVGFMFKKTSLFHIPVPFFGSFEEINLRFYVKRIEGKKIKKGVVFINETVPFKIVAILANILYKEHYLSIPTRHSIDLSDKINITYEWKINKKWNTITFECETPQSKIEPSSIEEFIFERYFGFTKINENTSQEFRINHPKWLTQKVTQCEINCDFTAMYGASFASLNQQKPDSILFANGSSVSVDWKRNKF